MLLNIYNFHPWKIYYWKLGNVTVSNLHNLSCDLEMWRFLPNSLKVSFPQKIHERTHVWCKLVHAKSKRIFWNSFVSSPVSAGEDAKVLCKMVTMKSPELSLQLDDKNFKSQITCQRAWNMCMLCFMQVLFIIWKYLLMVL